MQIWLQVHLYNSRTLVRHQTSLGDAFSLGENSGFTTRMTDATCTEVRRQTNNINRISQHRKVSKTANGLTLNKC